MPRPLWSGHISFGLVNIPVQLHTAEERQASVSFNMLDRRNNARVRNKRVNESTGKEVPYEEIVKGYQLDDGNYVTFTSDDLKELETEASQNIEIEEFVELAEIDRAFFEKPYYLLPGRKGEKGYVLLREALEERGKVGIAKVTIRTRQHLAAVVPEKRALMLYILRYEDEIRKPDQEKLPTESISDYKVTKKELEIAGQLIDTLTEKWEPAKYHDEYRESLLDWIEKKAKSDSVSAPEGEEEKTSSTEVIDIMELLKKSMDQTKKGRKKA